MKLKAVSIAIVLLLMGNYAYADLIEANPLGMLGTASAEFLIQPLTGTNPTFEPSGPEAWTETEYEFANFDSSLGTLERVIISYEFSYAALHNAVFQTTNNSILPPDLTWDFSIRLYDSSGYANETLSGQENWNGSYNFPNIPAGQFFRPAGSAGDPQMWSGTIETNDPNALSYYTNWIFPSVSAFISPQGNLMSALGLPTDDGNFVSGAYGLSDVPFNIEGAISVEDLSITYEYTPAPVPEPATMLLIGTGLAGLAAFRRKLKNKS